MYHRPIPNTSSQFVVDRFAELHRFLADRRDGLRNAAEMLAGRRGARLVDAILERLGYQSEPSRSTWAALRDLLGILTLEYVHDDQRLEAQLFAGIDPASPVVEEICLLADGLREALEASVDDPDLASHLRAVA